MRPTTALLLLLLLCALVPLPAAATVIYDWVGSCVTGCVGTAALHVETTDAYVPGTLVRDVPSLIHEVRYTDSRGSETQTGAQILDLDFFLLLPIVDGSGQGLVLLDGKNGLVVFNEHELKTFTDGSWRWLASAAPGQCDPPGTITPCNHVAAGVGSVWSSPSGVSVPAPAGLLLLVAGLALLGALSLMASVVADLTGRGRF